MAWVGHVPSHGHVLRKHTECNRTKNVNGCFWFWFCCRRSVCANIRSTAMASNFIWYLFYGRRLRCHRRRRRRCQKVLVRHRYCVTGWRCIVCLVIWSLAFGSVCRSFVGSVGCWLVDGCPRANKSISYESEVCTIKWIIQLNFGFCKRIDEFCACGGSAHRIKSQHITNRIWSGIVNVVKTTDTDDERFIFTLSVCLRFKMAESQSSFVCGWAGSGLCSVQCTLGPYCVYCNVHLVAISEWRCVPCCIMVCFWYVSPETRRIKSKYTSIMPRGCARALCMYVCVRKPFQ